MEFSEEAMVILRDAIEYVRENNFEYVTPEIILLIIAADSTFAAAFEECGGDTEVLCENIYEYTEKLSRCSENKRNVQRSRWHKYKNGI